MAAEQTAGTPVQELKEVLGAISRVRSESADAEIRFRGLAERFRTRVLAASSADARAAAESEEADCRLLQSEWDAVSAECARAGPGLEDVRAEFAAATQRDVAFLLEDVAVLAERFRDSGPARGGLMPAKGVTVLQEMQTAVGEQAARRAHLVHAQKLFGLDVTPCPKLKTVRCALLIACCS